METVINLELKPWQLAGVTLALSAWQARDESIRRRIWRLMDAIEPNKDFVDAVSWQETTIAGQTNIGFRPVNADGIEPTWEVKIPDNDFEFFAHVVKSWPGWSSGKPIREFFEMIEVIGNIDSDSK